MVGDWEGILKLPALLFVVVKVVLFVESMNKELHRIFNLYSFR